MVRKQYIKYKVWVILVFTYMGFENRYFYMGWVRVFGFENHATSYLSDYYNIYNDYVLFGTLKRSFSDFPRNFVALFSRSANRSREREWGSN